MCQFSNLLVGLNLKKKKKKKKFSNLSLLNWDGSVKNTSARKSEEFTFSEHSHDANLLRIVHVDCIYRTKRIYFRISSLLSRGFIRINQLANDTECLS